MCVVSWTTSQRSVAGLSISIKFSLKANTCNRAFRPLLFSYFTEIRSEKDERSWTSVEVQLCLGIWALNVRREERKHFLWRGWQCGLPVHSHPQSRGNSGLGNKWSLVSCLSAQKDGGVLRVGVIWVHLQLQLECKQFLLLKENVILPWIWILHFNFSSPQTSLFFCHCSPWWNPYFAVIPSQPSEMSLPFLSASLPASTSREEQKTVKEPTTKSSLCKPPATSHYKPQPCVCTTRTAASALQSSAEGQIPTGVICSSFFPFCGSSFLLSLLPNTFSSTSHTTHHNIHLCAVPVHSSPCMEHNAPWILWKSVVELCHL